MHAAPWMLFSLLSACNKGPSTGEIPKELAEQVLDKPATRLEVAVAGDAPEIAAIQPGELSAPPNGGDGDGTRVLLVGPQGAQVSPRQAVVIFDRPMVALDQLDAMGEKVPLTCSAQGDAALRGKTRWAGTSTAVWIPEGDHFPKGNAITCVVADGARAQDGTALRGAVEFSFETARPTLTSSEPYDRAPAVDPARPMLLVFDQDVALAQIQEHLSLLDQSGKKVKFSLSRASEPNPKGDEDPVQKNVPTVFAREVERSALITAPLQRDSGYTLVLSPGLRGVEGPLGTTEATEIGFRTVPPPEILDAWPRGREVDPFTEIRLDLKTRTDAAELGARMHISPAPPDGWDPAEAYSWSSWVYGVRLKPMTDYTITVDAGAKDSFGQVYAEGTSWSFKTGHLPPLLDAPSQLQLYPATNPTTVPIRSRNLRTLNVGAAAVDVATVMREGRSWLTWDSRPAPKLPSSPIFADGETTDAVRVDTFDLAPLLKDGHGLVMLEAWSPEVTEGSDHQVSRSLLQVTDLGTNLKIGPGGAVVWVTRLSSGAPVADASVTLFVGDKQAWTGKTGKDGLAKSPPILPKAWRSWDQAVWAIVTSGTDVALTTSEDPNDVPTWGFGLNTDNVAANGALRVHSFTDRGVYRPGDTIHVALTARATSKDGLSVVPDAVATWTCADARGVDLGGDTGKLNSHGALTFNVTLPPEASLGYGRCQVNLKTSELEASEWIQLPVYAYRAPTFRVDVSAPEHALVGSTLSAIGHGRYLFGAPMAGAEASWSVYAMDVLPQPKGWERFSFQPPTGRAWWDNEYRPTETVATGEGKLDPAGQIKISVDLPATEEPRTRQYTTEVTGIDVARQRISNRTVTVVDPADVYVGLKPTSFLGASGTENRWELVVVSPEGAVKSGVPVDISVVRRTWDSIRQKGMDGRWTWVSTPKDDTVEKKTVASTGGPTAFSFTPKEGGYYVIQASARDSAGRLTRTEDSVYVYCGDVSWARDDQNKVDLVPDKNDYAPGETAKILVKAPRAGLTGLITIEREGVLDQQVRRFEGASDAIEIPLGEDAVPNVFVSVVLVDGAPPANSPDSGIPSYAIGYAELKVSPSARHLKVDIETDKETYQPGDDVIVSVNVGRPTSSAPDAPTKPVADAHVVLYAVDYGVLSLTGYETPDAFGVYYAPHALRVRTADNRTRILDRGHFLAKGAEVGGGGGEGVRTRTKFVTTPLWDGDLSTMKDGRLVRKFKLPDNLTTFQIMAVVDAGAEAFGSGARQVRVSLPLLAQPAMPRVLRTGDRALAGVVVHNNRDVARSVEVKATATGVALAGSPKTVEVPANGAVEVPFALTQPVAGTATLRFEVRADKDSDALVHSLPVLRPVPADVVATAGVADPSATENINRVDGVIADVGGLTVQVAPTALVGLDASFQYLLDYPHGCLEQTTSRLLAAQLALELGDRIEVPVTPEKLKEHVQIGLARIADFHHASGGYAYWPGGRDPSALGTAAALEAMARAGQKPPTEAVQFLREFMAGRWMPWWWEEDTRLNAQTRVALTLARIAQGDTGFNSRLYEHRDQLSLTARGELMEALARTSGADSRTAELTRDLKGAVTVEATTARLRDQDDWTALWDGEMSGTASALAGWLKADPKNPLVPRLARGLVAGRMGGRWGNTWTTLRAFRALTDYANVAEAGGLPKGATATLGGQSILSAQFSGPRAQSATVSMADLKSGALNIQSQGGPVYYEARLAYAAESMPPRDEGFTLTRAYQILEGTGEAGAVTPGALVQVTLRIVTPVDRTLVAVTDPLPAGLEPVDTFFKTTASNYTDDEDADTGMMDEPGEGDDGMPVWSTWVFNHRELRDDGLTLYADYMPAGIHTYQYLARATTPGDYAQPAARVEEMYRPEVFGRTEAGRFVVGAGPVATK